LETRVIEAVRAEHDHLIVTVIVVGTSELLLLLLLLLGLVMSGASVCVIGTRRLRWLRDIKVCVLVLHVLILLRRSGMRVRHELFRRRALSLIRGEVKRASL